MTKEEAIAEYNAVQAKCKELIQMLMNSNNQNNKRTHSSLSKEQIEKIYVQLKKIVILKEGPNGERTERWGIVPGPDYDWRTVITQEQYDLLVSKGIEVDDKRYKVVEKQDNSKKY